MYLKKCVKQIYGLLTAMSYLQENFRHSNEVNFNISNKRRYSRLYSETLSYHYVILYIRIIGKRQEE